MDSERLSTVNTRAVPGLRDWKRRGGTDDDLFETVVMGKGTAK
jgi:hypothetical protein